MTICTIRLDGVRMVRDRPVGRVCPSVDYGRRQGHFGRSAGVTVEAASPAPVEKVRAVVSDGTGQYRIENLRPGAYTVTFTLAGFATVLVQLDF